MQSSLDAFMSELIEYSNRQHTQEDIREELKRDVERNYMEFDE